MHKQKIEEQNELVFNGGKVVMYIHTRHKEKCAWISLCFPLKFSPYNIIKIRKELKGV